MAEQLSPRLEPLMPNGTLSVWERVALDWFGKHVAPPTIQTTTPQQMAGRQAWARHLYQ